MIKYIFASLILNHTFTYAEQIPDVPFTAQELCDRMRTNYSNLITVATTGKFEVNQTNQNIAKYEDKDNSVTVIEKYGKLKNISSIQNRKYIFTKDKEGRLTQIESVGSFKTSYKYDENGKCFLDQHSVINNKKEKVLMDHDSCINELLPAMSGIDEECKKGIKNLAQQLAIVRAGFIAKGKTSDLSVRDNNSPILEAASFCGAYIAEYQANGPKYTNSFDSKKKRLIKIDSVSPNSDVKIGN